MMEDKLRKLIKVCRESGNREKPTVVGYILIANLVDEIGIKLGIRPRDTESKEKVFEYMILINRIFLKNFKSELFSQEIISSLKSSEIFILRRKMGLSVDRLRELFNVYYEIKGLNVKSLHAEITHEFAPNSELGQLHSYMSKPKGRSKNNNIFDLILKDKIYREEAFLSDKLKEGYDSEVLEETLRLKTMASMIDKKANKKVSVQGQLIDNMDYQQSVSDFIGYTFIGVSILFLLLGVLILFESVQSSQLWGSLSWYSGASLMLGVLNWLIYSRNFKKR